MLQTERLRLIPQTMANLYSTHVYASDPENTRYMINLPNETIEDTMAFLQRAEREWFQPIPHFYEFAIMLGDTHIGAMSTSRKGEDGVFELGWILDRRYWGQGYAFEAATALVAFTRDELGAKRIIAHCDAENIRSSHLMEKLGMKQVGRTSDRNNVSSGKVSVELEYALDL